jgi:hypothetical protein
MAKTNPPRSLGSAPRHHGRTNRSRTVADSPSPGGEGRSEGEETLRTPARLRIADEVGDSERRNTKLHTRQSDESLAVASRLPPHPSPLPQGEGTAHPALRRVEALWIGESVACGSPSPRGEGRGGTAIELRGRELSSAPSGRHICRERTAKIQSSVGAASKPKMSPRRGFWPGGIRLLQRGRSYGAPASQRPRKPGNSSIQWQWGRGEGGPILARFQRRDCRWNARRRGELRAGGVKQRSEALAFSPLHHGHGLS